MDTFLLVIRVVLSLGAVLFVLWAFQRRFFRMAGGPQSAKLLQVTARQGIGAKASVVMLDAEGKRFILGVTEHSVTVLHEAELPEPVSDSFAASLEAAALLDGNDDATGDQSSAGLRRRRGGRKPASELPPAHGSVLSGETWRAAARALRDGQRR